MIAQRYKDMLSGKSVIRQISEWSTARGTEIGYENVFDYSLGNPSVPCPEHFTKTCIDLLQTKEPVTLHGYSPTLTIPAVRKAVAESLNRRFGMDYGMEHIFMDFREGFLKEKLPADIEVVKMAVKFPAVVV